MQTMNSYLHLGSCNLIDILIISVGTYRVRGDSTIHTVIEAAFAGGYRAIGENVIFFLKS